MTVAHALRRALLLLTVLASTGGCGGKQQPSEPRSATSASAPAPGPDPAPDVSDNTLATLDRLSVIARAQELTSTERSLLNGAHLPEVRAFVRAMAASPEAIRRAPFVLFPLHSSRPAPDLEVPELISFVDKGKTILFFEQNKFTQRKRCTAAQAIEVTPWWDLTSKVWVCPESYQPNGPLALRTPAGRPFNCPTDVGKQSCGCGPYLMLCAPSWMTDAIGKSFYQEFLQTIEHQLARGMTFAEMMTSKYSFRDRFAELMERRARVAAGQNPADVFRDFPQWPEQGVWAARTDLAPGQHAGVLSIPQYLWFQNGPRERMNDFQQDLWCTGFRSKQVDAHALMSLNTPDFRYEKKEGYRIAHMQVCDGCHARMDYGMPFFRGHETIPFVAPSDADATSSIYFYDQNDKRYDGAATPQQFAQFATAMPEFRQCMTRRIVEQVFGDAAERSDFEAVESVYNKTPTYQALLAEALSRRLERELAPHSSPKVAAKTPSLHALLHEHCVDCHDEGHEVDLSKDELPVDVVRRAIFELGARRMPRGFPPLGLKQRNLLINALAEKLPDPVERRNLVELNTRQRENIGVPLLNVAQSLILGAGKSPNREMPHNYMLVSPSLMELNPDVALQLATDVKDKCAAYPSGKERTACIEAAVDTLDAADY
jgi:hypothetical protein